MYLKSLEVQGFKSFANKMRFEFHNGITGIVGPNGSGKSNVADAVRWVLGEQKIKQLRGAKMEDVIFSGTENRKPLGFAYVAITLDNSDHVLPVDFEEVTVSRRLFRSGESEYMMNGTACRLRDINELFYDTGIGKDGYSMIGQGQIDKILNGKPDERRELFDEAAGIVKFKRRKNEALKKLEDENQNLVRVEDILGELEKQVGPLKIQSEKAKNYLEYKNALRKADIDLFQLRMKDLSKKHGEANQALEIASEDLEETKEAFEETKQKYEELETYIENLNAKVNDLTRQAGEKKEEIQIHYGQIELLKEQIHSVKNNDEFYNKQLVDSRENLEKKEKELSLMEEEKEKIAKELSDQIHLREDSDSILAFKKQELEERRSELESAKQELINNENETSKVHARMEGYDRMLSSVKERNEEILAKLAKSKEDQSLQAKLIESLKSDLQKNEEEVADTKEKSEHLVDAIVDLQKDCQEKRQILEKNRGEYHRVSSRLESLKNITERYEGYGNSIKRIMEQKGRFKGIIGVVADIIKTEEKYETAIETALGGSIQNVVTDNEVTAKNLIAFLKENKAGRATFLPLSAMNNKTGFTREEALREPGVIGLASELVSIKTEYEGVAKFLLGRTLVLDTIDHAIAMARKYRYSLRMVTLDGEQLNPGGSMSGGAFKNSSNLLGRRREIEDLQKQVDDLAKVIQDKKTELAKQELDLVGLKEESEKARDVLQQQIILLNNARMKVTQADKKREELENSVMEVSVQKEKLEDELSEIQENNKKLGLDLSDFEKIREELKERIELASQEVSNKENEISEIENKVHNSELIIGEIKSRNAFNVQNMERIKEEIADLKEEILRISQNQDGSKDAVSNKEAEILSLNQKLEVLKKEQESLDETIRLAKEEYEDQSSSHKDFFRKREEFSNRISELDKEIYRLNSSIEKYEDQENSMVEYLWTEYELTASEAEAEGSKEEELSTMKTTDLNKEVNSLKGKIKGLGSVDVNSIEQYKEVGARYEFMSAQHKDLIEAKENLMGIVAELDKGMRKQFNEKFAQIQSEFNKVFQELFGGGKGEIILEEGDVLESEIRIVSQPPGKKLKNMMQMSGGEKALTAISLLFAIQNLKPSPFCLLDEIEAALDDSNVTRFAEYLHKLTENTQFIVITHRRGTMNAADRLYGITMQEKGVSTLVSVNLIEDQLGDDQPSEE